MLIAGHVAVEEVTGSLEDGSGTLIFTIIPSWNGEKPHSAVATDPYSGTGQLTGVTGTMNIRIAEGKPYDGFNYPVPKHQKALGSRPRR